MMGFDGPGTVQLSRTELYDLVWREPLNKLAARFQMSDVALRKRCIKHRIPLPGRGYWRRLETGGAVRRAVLPKLAHNPMIRFIITESQVTPTS